MEPLQNSGRSRSVSEMGRIKAQFAGNSWTIAKICNAVTGDFGLIDADHELIRGSLKFQGTLEFFVSTVDFVNQQDGGLVAAERRAPAGVDHARPRRSHGPCQRRRTGEVRPRVAPT